MADPFEQIVGAEHVSSAGSEALDGVPVGSIVRPGSAEEVAACLAQAREHRLAVVPCGGGTKLGQGNAPRAASVVRLDLGRLLEPVLVQPDEGIAEFGAGLTLRDAESETRRLGMRTALAGAPGATVGGTIAADPVAPDAGPDRRLRNDLLGLEVALVNGTLTKSGGRVVKNVTGFDLVRLYCGSFGTLGVITRAILRVRPLPEQVRVLERDFASLDDALAGAVALAGARVEPAGVALLPHAAGAQLIWRLEGRVAEVDARAARWVGSAASDEDWARVEQRSQGAGAAGGVRVRLAARPSDTRALVREALARGGAGAPRLVLPAAGLVLADVPESALDALFSAAERAGWLLFVESAGPETKARLDVFGPPSAALPLMRELKRRFDPDGVLAPGRFVGGI